MNDTIEKIRELLNELEKPIIKKNVFKKNVFKKNANELIPAGLTTYKLNKNHIYWRQCLRNNYNSNSISY